MNWGDRLKVALGSARGIAYLHHECSPKIVHSNIKSSNILLDENLEPHVTDFGLAKLLVDKDSHVTTVVAGTFGYLAPGMYLVLQKLYKERHIYIRTLHFLHGQPKFYYISLYILDCKPFSATYCLHPSIYVVNN